MNSKPTYLLKVAVRSVIDHGRLYAVRLDLDENNKPHWFLETQSDNKTDKTDYLLAETPEENMKDFVAYAAKKEYHLYDKDVKKLEEFWKVANEHLEFLNKDHSLGKKNNKTYKLSGGWRPLKEYNRQEMDSVLLYVRALKRPNFSTDDECVFVTHGYWQETYWVFAGWDWCNDEYVTLHRDDITDDYEVIAWMSLPDTMQMLEDNELFMPEE